MKNRLERLRSNPEFLKRYEDAKRYLLEIGFDALMLELAFSVVAEDSPDLIERNALTNQRRLGFVEAVEVLFNLEGAALGVPKRLESTYSAIENLRNSGKITEEEYHELEKDNEL